LNEDEGRRKKNEDERRRKKKERKKEKGEEKKKKEEKKKRKKKKRGGGGKKKMKRKAGRFLTREVFSFKERHFLQFLPDRRRQTMEDEEERQLIRCSDARRSP